VYIFAVYVTTDLTNCPAGKVIGVTSDSTLNVRSSPSTTASIVGKLNYNTKFIIQTSGSNSAWFCINYGDTQGGYVSTQYVQKYTQVTY